MSETIKPSDNTIEALSSLHKAVVMEQDGSFGVVSIGTLGTSRRIEMPCASTNTIAVSFKTRLSPSALIVSLGVRTTTDRNILFYYSPALGLKEISSFNKGTEYRINMKTLAYMGEFVLHCLYITPNTPASSGSYKVSVSIIGPVEELNDPINVSSTASVIEGALLTF